MLDLDLERQLNKVKLNMKLTLVGSLAWAILIYGQEVWTLVKTDEKRKYKIMDLGIGR